MYVGEFDDYKSQSSVIVTSSIERPQKQCLFIFIHSMIDNNTEGHRDSEKEIGLPRCQVTMLSLQLPEKKRD
jgi:hypothetical protein